MRVIKTLDEFALFVAASGLGPIQGADLERLKVYYDGACAMTQRLDEIVAPADEPASIFVAEPHV